MARAYFVKMLFYCTFHLLPWPRGCAGLVAMRWPCGPPACYLSRSLHGLAHWPGVAICRFFQIFTVTYFAIKHLHITFALLSGLFFLLRGVWMLLESSLLQRRWVRVLPHVVDTLLLASALVLVFWSGQYPFAQPWLTAKVLALIAYIVLGTLALKRGKTKLMRVNAFVAALSFFVYMLAVARTREPLIPFQVLGWA